MTLERDKFIKIPTWILTMLLPGLVAFMVSYGSWNSTKATLETKSIKNEQEIKALQEQKVDRNEFIQFMNSLNRIENKLDYHIDKDKK